MSIKLFAGALAFALVLAGLLPVPAAEGGKPALVDRVRDAIKNGVQYLRDMERGRGNWEIDKYSFNVRGGWSCLAMLALLNSGEVKRDDPIIERGLEYLRQIEPEKTYEVGLQTMVFAEAGRNQDRERIQRNVNWLIDAMVKRNGQCRGWTYFKAGIAPSSDNSNTQYALLGLHAGKQAGAKIDREVWRSIRNYYIDTQQRDHGWLYNPDQLNEGSSLTMTTAGLCGLLISGMELAERHETILPDGTATNCGRYEENRPVMNAMAWIADHFRIDLPSNTYYNLYGIERAGRLSGQRFFGDHDWYREGCEFLVHRQQQNGAWSGDRAHDWPVVSTSFALLFLSKGRMPVLISKLVHGPGEDWNNDRNDARHLVEYAGKEVFRNRPMAWQVFDTRRIEVNSDEAVQNLVKDLLQSPILYFNGHKDLSPWMTGVQKELIKGYVEQGGFVLGEACCGRPEFDEGFRKLMKELFPNNPLKKLGPEHPIWKAHAVIPPDSFPLWGIDYGCKTVVIYSPKDLSCLWEANQSDQGLGRLAFRLGGNIIAYATGMEPPKDRLSPVELVTNDKEGAQIPRGFMQVAQLRHEGDWQPAPKAMRNLMDHLRKTAKLDVALQTRPIYGQDPDIVDYKFLYMHGRGNFVMSTQAIKNLQLNLETGGLIFADACCGKQAFDTSFREFAAQLFPGKKLEPIPITDDLYSEDVNVEAIRTVKCRTEHAAAAGQAADFRVVAPYLEGIKIGNRWAIIYSKYDIGCALENHQSTDCLGHDHESALKLGRAAVLYALKR